MPLEQRTRLETEPSLSEIASDSSSQSASTTTGTSSPITLPPQPENRWTNPRSLRHMLGDDLSQVHFKQGSTGDCYLVSVFDLLLRHPRGQQLLDQMIVEECRDDRGRLAYKITFPSGRWGAFYEWEVGRSKHGRTPLSGPKPLQMMELAYSHMTRKARNQARKTPFDNDGRCNSPIILEEGYAETVLKDLIGGETGVIKVECCTPPQPDIDHTVPFSQHPNGLKRVQTLLEHINTDPKHDYLLTASTPSELETTKAIYTKAGQKFTRQHVYSIRGFDLNARTITVANPHDTKHKVHTLSLSEFCEVFKKISGLRLSKEPMSIPLSDLLSASDYQRLNAFQTFG